VITPLVLLDVVYTSWTWTFLRELPDSRKTSGFLSFLVSLLAAGGTVLKLFASLAFVPRFLVDNTDLVSACNTGKYISLYAAEVDLAGIAGAAPSKVGCKSS
jgi:hypothetical protein